MTPYSDKAPATAATAAFTFYDVEALHNVFTVTFYNTKSRETAVFYQLDTTLVDDRPGVATLSVTADVMMKMLADQTAYYDMQEQVIAANPTLVKTWGDYAPVISYHNLADVTAARDMARLMGGLPLRTDHTSPRCAVNNELLVYDTHADYDPTIHPTITGYNSNQYDTSILALYFAHRFDKDGNATAVSAQTMRQLNDEMFELIREKNDNGYRKSMTTILSDHPRARTIRMAWINSGRHLDVARLNELQQKVALKRLLGLLGYQILESDKLAGPGARVETVTEFIDLIAYNISDAVGTASLMKDSVYASSFDMRAQLLRTYPETIFKSVKPGVDFRTPDQRPQAVNAWPRPRLTIDSSSAQFIGRILAPYRDLDKIPGHVGDLPVVSFRYPDPLLRDISNKPRNVLTHIRDFFFESLPPESSPAAMQAHLQFEQIYNYYRSIEGLSFNSQQNGESGPRASWWAVTNALVEIVKIDTSKHIENTNLAKTPPTEIIAKRLVKTELIELYHEYCGVMGYLDSDNTLDITITLQETWALIDRVYVQFYKMGHDVGKAAIQRLRLIITAWADSQDPYWPKDRYAKISQIPLTFHNDPAHWRNTAHTLAEVATPPSNIAYFAADGKPTSCFATFSTGGIHGAEASIDKYRARVAANDLLWPNFHQAIAIAADQYDRAQTLMTTEDLDPTISKGFPPEHPGAALGHKMSPKKLVNGINGGTKWLADGAAATMPAISDPAGQPYDPLTLAKATWWIRTCVWITVPVLDPETGSTQPHTMHWDDILAGGRRAGDPMLRSEPKGVVSAVLFPESTSAEVALVPETTPRQVHRSNKLDSLYRHTSVGDVTHEDFTSYYPLMLTNLGTFINPDLAEPGEDPRDKYGEIFNDKERFGKLQKDPSNTPEETARYKNMREGTKLLLNAASGAADAGHANPIVSNNMIVAMRIIGQNFSWLIGQAQTFADTSGGTGTIVSTNTDGLYSTLDDETNQKVLDEYASTIGVTIEPEPLTLVSKDANNRVEFFTAEDSARILKDPTAKPWQRVVASAGGASLACWNGPNARKALSHPAMYDRMLVEYFKYIVGNYGDASIDEPMNLELMTHRLAEVEAEIGVRESLRYYQNLLASSPNANSYIFAADYRLDSEGNPIKADDTLHLTFPGDERTITTDPEQLRAPDAISRLRLPGDHVPRVIGHYNRVFRVDPDKVHAAGIFGAPVTLAAAKAATVGLSTQQARRVRGEREIHTANPVAKYLLGQAGADASALEQEFDIKTTLHTGVDSTAPMLIFNGAISDHPDEGLLTELLACIDRGSYLEAVASSYLSQWSNHH